MKVIMYGSEICSDCVEAKEQLMNCTNITLEYRNITETTAVLKEFLSYRDHETMFTPVRERGKIGIPFFILEDGTKTFDISDFIAVKNSGLERPANSCSLDGHGNC